MTTQLHAPGTCPACDTRRPLIANLDPTDLVDPVDVREIRRRLLVELAEELDQRAEAKRKRGLEATGARQLRQRFYDVADGIAEAAAAVRRHQP